MLKIIDFAHSLIMNCTTKTDIVIDATMGNGKDTLILANSAKTVYSFDIQEDAINNTKKLLKKYNIDNVVLIKDGHENILNYDLKNVSGIIFNLGFLPNGDKTISTMWQTTIKAIDDGLKILKIGGVMAIVIYPGHPNGFLESINIQNYCKRLDQKKFSVLMYNFINWVNNPPYLIAIEKIK